MEIIEMRLKKKKTTPCEPLPILVRELSLVLKDLILQITKLPL